MYEQFGATVTGDSVTFRLFFPDASRDASQYTRGGLPRIDEVRVAGDFQAHAGAAPWDPAAAPVLTRRDHPRGLLYTATVDELAEGFYQYKYVVTFENGTSRWCTDPCTKYIGPDHENAGFVVGGHTTTVEPIGARKPLPELVIYELMIDDFTAAYRGDRAPLDAVVDRLDELVALGVNAIEFLPWTAWRGSGFSWGYDPFLFFAVANRYVEGPEASADRLVRLKQLVNECHARGLHVIMDGVFNHVNAGLTPDTGFPYYWLYQNPAESPFIGRFAGAAFFEDFDFANTCTQKFIRDVCRYWLDTYELDGIRFDYTIGLHEGGSHDDNVPGRGLGRLIADLRAHLADRPHVALMIEHLTDDRYAAIDVANAVDATGCWYDRYLYDMGGYAASGSVDAGVVRLLDSTRDFAPGKSPVIYTENHDHSAIVNRVGGRGHWWRTQPTAIALATTPGGLLLHNGQEFGDDHWLPNDGPGRVVPRPVQWHLADDPTGQWLRQLHQRLLRIRAGHPALVGPNVYPRDYDERWTSFNEFGYGADRDRGLVIFHRWGPTSDGRLERFIIVLNFSGTDHPVDVPFSVDGRWEDLLNGDVVDVADHWARAHLVPSHWGRILWRAD